MNPAEIELEKRLDALPDGNPDFTRCGMHILKNTGLVEEALDILRNEPDATVDTVTMFESGYRGTLEFYDDDGRRVPVDIRRLRLTQGMRDILVESKNKTFKSYELAPVSNSNGTIADSSVRLSFGQRAIEINCFNFVYDVGGVPVELTQLLCERRSLLDGFRMWSDAPTRMHLVGERITGVELVTDHVEFEGGLTLDIDSAVGICTAHGVYTFARESWESTGICIASSGELSVPSSADELNEEWLRVHPELGKAKVRRTTTKLR